MALGFGSQTPAWKEGREAVTVFTPQNPGILFTQTQKVTISGVNGAETPRPNVTLFGDGIGTRSIPAQFLRVGDTVTGKLWGYYTTEAAPVSPDDSVRFNFQFKIFGTTVFPGVLLLPIAQALPSAWEMEFMFTVLSIGDAASGQITFQGKLYWEEVGNTDSFLRFRYSETDAPTTLNTENGGLVDLVCSFDDSSSTNQPDNTWVITHAFWRIN